MPVDCGGLLVREPSALREAFSLVPPYLKDNHADGHASGSGWFSEYGPEQTRPFRALRAWATHSGAWSIRHPTWSGPRRWSPRSSRSGAARRA
ncbi:MAG TPA: hypothetical protein VHY31_13705 [Streptosporangiaceae bacterium]|nr:hypothetical protein [Streptosporangiaceae bacterium]